MPRLPPARSSGRPDPNRVPVPALLAGLAIVAVAISLVWAYQATRPPATNPENLCRIDQAPPEATTIVIDTTDALAESERAQIVQEIERIREQVPAMGLIEIVQISEDASAAPAPILSLCNPGHGREMNALYQNPKLAEKRWNDAFRSPLELALSQILGASSGRQSPLMESLRRLSAERINRPELDASSKRLVVFSDLLQHTARYSQYGSADYSFERFKASDEFDGLRGDLRQVSVDIFYIARPRTQALQSKQHLQFWVDYFEASGGSVDSVKKILGD